MAGNVIKGLTVEIGGDTTKLGKALDDVNKKSRSLSGELGEVNRLLKLDPGNADLLAQKQKILAEAVANTAKRLDTLKEAEKQVQAQFERGEVSEEQVRALQREIIATTKKMDGYEKAAKETAEAIDSLGKGSDEAQDGVKKTGKEAGNAAGKVDDFADAAKDADKAGGSLGETLSNAAKIGLQAVAAAATAAVAGLTAAAESTREYRTEMSKLDTAFTQNGFTSKAATSAYKDLVSVLGETDQSVEAANHLAKLLETEKDLATWTGDILPGVYATFGASLPIEGLTEAANETAKVGQVTGPLADALNWAGVSEDEFNKSLEQTNSEQERAALITETLTELYSSAGEAFKETNAEVIAANAANEAWTASLAEIGGAVEPVLTSIKMMGASALAEAVPAVQALSDAFMGLMNGDAGALSKLGASISSIFSELIAKIAGLVPQIAQFGLSIITSLATSIQTNLPLLMARGAEILTNLGNGIQQNMPTFLTQALNIISQFAQTIYNSAPALIQAGLQVLTNLSNGIRSSLPGFISQALDIIMQFAQKIYDGAPALIETGFQVLSNLVQGIMDSLPTLLEKAPEIISKFANVINDNFPTILEKGVELIGQIIKGIIRAIPSLIAAVPKIIAAIVDVWSAFNWVNLGKNAINLLKDGILGMLSAVKSAGTSVMNAVTEAIRNLPSKLMSLGKSGVTSFSEAIRSGASLAKSAAKSIFDSVVNTLTGMPTKMLSIGKDLVKGLWNGISDMTGWIIDKIGGFTDSVLSSIKGFFGIKSPSKVFRDEIGKMLVEGMAEGVLDNADAPIKAMRNVSDGVLDAAENNVDGLSLERQISRAPVVGLVSESADMSLWDKLDKILAAIERGQVLTIDGTQLVGATAAKYDSTLGQRRALAARGAV